MSLKFFIRKAAMICLPTALIIILQTKAFSSEYYLGPQDRVEIKIHDLRAGTGEAHQWAAFDGEFIISAAGKLSLPLIGDINVEGKTVESVSQLLAAKIQLKVGLAQLPSAAVQIVKYRPFYINGVIDKPGEYEYRPGLTVLQALSIAGGLTQSRDGALLGFEREALTQRGDLRAFEAERTGLIIKKYRLEAEVNEASSISFPKGISSSISTFNLDRAMKEENLLFETRRNGLKAQLDALENARKLLSKELVSLDEKDQALSHQIDLIKKELIQVSGLVTKGLAVLPRQFTIEQSVAAYEGNRIDIKVTKLRAQQDLSRIERDIIDLQSKRRSEILLESAEVRNKLSNVNEKIETATKLIYQSEVVSPRSISVKTNDAQISYTLTRVVSGNMTVSSVGEGDFVEPGDVIRVSLATRSTNYDSNK